MVASKKISKGQREKRFIIGSPKLYVVLLEKIECDDMDPKEYLYIVRAYSEKQVKEILSRQEDMAFSGWELPRILAINPIGKPEILFERGEKE